MATTTGHVNVEHIRRAYTAFAAADMATVSEHMELSGGTFRLEVHDIPANHEHAIGLVTERAEKDGKKLESRTVHVIHTDSEGRNKEFWA